MYTRNFHAFHFLTLFLASIYLLYRDVDIYLHCQPGYLNSQPNPVRVDLGCGELTLVWFEKSKYVLLLNTIIISIQIWVIVGVLLRIVYLSI